MMKYISTRGTAPALTFEDVLLTGLARDGGLYVPEVWPQFTAADLRRLQDASYQDIVTETVLPFVEGALSRDELTGLVGKAYAGFHHDAVAPLKQLSHRVWMMELFNGPTLAFKDFALQLLGQLFDHVLKKRGQRITIVGATSGDTGSAAIEACRGSEAIDIFILHPHGRTSEVQRRQMTTVADSNVHNIAVNGTFDDCQDIVKALFNDQAFRDEAGLSAVNSINWARIMTQIAYYVAASVRLGGPDRMIDVAVPTGNFGNVFAAYGAKKMGVPIGRLGVASNRNDILTRFLTDNDMSAREVEPSLSPSMDIQVSSNFERLLFDLMGRDGDAVGKSLTDFRQNGRLTIGQGGHGQATAEFHGLATSDEQTLHEIEAVRQHTGEIIDPHTATAVRLARKTVADDRATVVMSTAHPAKFPDAVERATGIRPDLPPALSDLFSREERMTVMDNSVDAVRDFVRANSRAVS